MVFLRGAFYFTVLLLVVFIACKDDDMPPADPGKEVTDIDLVFNPVNGGAPLSFSATDPDGNGPEDVEVDPIILGADNSYQLFIRVRNDIDNVDLTETIKAEGSAHMLFFGFTDELFYQPEGNGNIDVTSDQVNYIDEDENGLPIGLITGWQTSGGANGTLRIVLKDQSDMKSTMNGVDVGVTDFDVTFNVTVE